MADDKEKDKNRPHLGYVVKDVCPCGAAVKLYERQELVFNPNEDCWNRMCGICITRDRTFSSTSARVA